MREELVHGPKEGRGNESGAEPWAKKGEEMTHVMCVYPSAFYPIIEQRKLTIETSSNMILNSFARFKRSSLILAETISRFVISSEAGYQRQLM